MNREEYIQLCNYTDELQDALLEYQKNGSPSRIYDTATKVEMLYGSEILGLSDALEQMSNYSGLVERYCNVIIAILKRFKVSDEGGGSFVKNMIDNVFLSHASDVLADTEKGLTGTKIVEYCNSYAVDFNVAIPIDSSNFGRFGSRVPNKRTALLRNLCAFDAKQQFRIIKELCELDHFSNNEDAQKLKEQLYIKYGFLAEGSLTSTELIVKTKHWLENYPNSLQEYNSALTKYESGIFERNTLDDMRLSFELLVKELLNNGRSLENQTEDLGRMLKDSGVSGELRNMVVKIIDYYTKYQDNHVKHDSSVNSAEIEYIIEQTSILMKFLIKINGGTN